MIMESENLVDINDIYENLDNLESNFLDLEDPSVSNNIDSTKIHTTFRYAHNLKSLLAMLQKTECSKLMHSIESNFDLIRNGKKSVTGELIQKCLTALDTIKESIRNSSEDIPAIEIQCREMKEIFEKQPVSQNNHSVELPISDHHHSLLYESQRNGLNVYQLEKIVTTDISREYYNNMPVYETIRSIGDLITFYPDYDKIPKNIPEYVVKILFSTNLNEEELYDHIFDPFKKIDPVENNKDEFNKNPVENAIPDNYISLQNGSTSLIIEYSFEYRKIIMDVFRNFGYYDIAINCDEVINAIRKAIKTNQHYDFLYLGNLEQQKSLELIEEIRLIEGNNNILGFSRCCIIVSAQIEEEKNIINLYKQGCDLFISRSGIKEELLEVIENIRKKKVDDSNPVHYNDFPELNYLKETNIEKEINKTRDQK
jgi:two-component system, chemotaxis family, chemotaxis protein CheY